jgi:NitT/TauT family transport system substrate-binding protein
LNINSQKDIFRSSLNATENPPRIVYITDYSDSGDVIIGRSDIGSLSELKGKTVSFEGVNSFSHIFVLTALTKAGLQEYDIKCENIDAQSMLKALEEKKIDAGHAWEPVKSQLLKKGYKVLSKAGDYPGIITDVLVFTPDVIKERPDEILAIVKSLFDALNYLKSHRDESVKIMADSMGMSIQEMNAGIAGIYQPDVKENLALATTLPLTTSVKMIMDFYLKRGQLFNVVNVNDILELKFIQSLAERGNSNRTE